LNFDIRSRTQLDELAMGVVPAFVIISAVASSLAEIGVRGRRSAAGGVSSCFDAASDDIRPTLTTPSILPSGMLGSPPDPPTSFDAPAAAVCSPGLTIFLLLWNVLPLLASLNMFPPACAFLLLPQLSLDPMSSVNELDSECCSTEITGPNAGVVLVWMTLLGE